MRLTLGVSAVLAYITLASCNPEFRAAGLEKRTAVSLAPRADPPLKPFDCPASLKNHKGFYGERSNGSWASWDKERTWKPICCDPKDKEKAYKTCNGPPNQTGGTCKFPHVKDPNYVVMETHAQVGHGTCFNNECWCGPNNNEPSVHRWCNQLFKNLNATDIDVITGCYVGPSRLDLAEIQCMIDCKGAKSCEGSRYAKHKGTIKFFVDSAPCPGYKDTKY